jgi:5'-nucleotidase / UDP-sugar diphosphatase
MKLPMTLAAATLFVAAGCQTASKPASSLQPTPAVSQVSAPDPVAPVSVQPEPMMAAAPVDTSTPAPTPMTDISATASANGKYTIKAGDTLYRIAVTHYGDGKQWTKIAAANPGLSPTHLHVGQTITLP